VVTPYKPVAEAIDARYPFALTTGRLRDQWHGMSRTGTVPQLFAHSAEPSIEVSGIDAKRRLLGDGDFVNVTSRRGGQVMRVRVSDSLRAGQLFVAMHWGEEYLAGRGGSQGAGHGVSHGINTVTSPAVDRDSFQPELKHAAVRIEKIELPSRVVAFGWVDADHVVAQLDALRALFGRFEYASVVPFGRNDDAGARVGVLFRAAGTDTFDAATFAAIEAAIGIDAEHVSDDSHLLRYDDARRGHARRVLVRDDAIAAVVLVGDWSAEAWLKEYLEAAMPVAALGRLLLKPGSAPPSGFKSRGRVVCNCWNVGESEIAATLSTLDGAASDRLATLQQRLKCGTQCGSCLPELKRMIAETRGTVSA
jgi:assimilatory nitrate reductase catalytic subunit